MALSVIAVFSISGIEFASANQPGVWRWTAPTTGSLAVGYDVWLNLDGNGWALMLDDQNPSDLEYQHTQLPGTVVQLKVIAYDYVVEAVMDGNELVGTQLVKRYGTWSPNSNPNENNEGSGPGGCGKPFWTSR